MIHMTVPGIGTILIGASLVFQATAQAPTAEVVGSSSVGVGEGLDIGLLFLALGFIAMGGHLLVGRARALGWSQKRFRQNVGQLREVFPEEGKPTRTIVPAISTIVIGVALVFVAYAKASIAGPG